MPVAAMRATTRSDVRAVKRMVAVVWQLRVEFRKGLDASKKNMMR